VQIRQQVLSSEGQPDTWIPLLYELSGKGWEELDLRLMSLVEMSSADLGAENLRRLRTFARRVRHHLDSMAREIELLLPWLSLIQLPPAIFEAPATNPALLASWHNLLKPEHTPMLNEIGDFENASQALVAELLYPTRGNA
jgi:hypothetical protein